MRSINRLHGYGREMIWAFTGPWPNPDVAVPLSSLGKVFVKSQMDNMKNTRCENMTTSMWEVLDNLQHDSDTAKDISTHCDSETLVRFLFLHHCHAFLQILDTAQYE